MSKIQDLPVKYDYEGNGATTRFQFNSMFWNTSDIIVFKNGTQITSGFEIESNDNDSATVVFSSAPENGAKITLYRNLTAKRLTEYIESGTFRADPTNDELNHILGLIQQNREALGRCPQLGIESTRVDLTIADPQAGHAIVWNNDGTGLKSSEYIFDSAVDEVRTKTNLAINAATLATQKATAAAESETAAANSATAAEDSATAAEAAKAYAEAAITDSNLILVAEDLLDEDSCIRAALPNATAAANSATAAAESARLAGLSKTAAENAANNAADNSISAGQSATAAGISKMAADNAATNAANSATAAAESKTGAESSAATASTAATSAANSANIAIESKTAAENAEEQAKQWAIGVPGEPSGGSAKYWAERAEDAASGLENPANRDLSNLSADGQMIIDTVDGKISNCMLEIPQNLKLEISGDTFTIKSGSTIVLVGATYTTYTLTSDTIVDYSTNLPNVSNGLYYIFANSNGTVTRSAWIRITNCFSGTPLPNASDYPNSSVFFETSEKKKWYNNNGTWIDLGGSYPLGLFEVKNHKLSFAKDSNGNDMIFNGMGFVGHHIFIYPNINAYMPAELNPDGSLASTKVNTNALRIIEALSGYSVDSLKRWISLQSNHTVSNWSAYKEVNHDSEADYTIANVRYYARDINLIKMYRSGSVSAVGGVPLVEYYYDGSNITSFSPKQCVRLATVDMLPDTYTKGEVDTLLNMKADTATTLAGYGITDAYTKTEVNTALAGKANVATTLSGYGITDGANTALSNLNSDGQMIIDSQNGTISNCVLEIPQNLKLEISGGVITLKAGSVITLAQSTYATITTTVDKTYNASLSSDSTYFLFIDSSGMYLSLFAVDTAVSGATDSLAGLTYHTWFDTTNKVISRYSSDASTPSSTLAYPLCVIIKDSNGVRFAKDSNGNDMIFNGVGFIGHHALVLPNVKVLIPNGLNDDGSLKSVKINNNALRIVEMITTTPAAGYEKILQMGSLGIYTSTNYREVESYNDLGTQNYSIQYVKKDNIIYYYNNDTYETRVIIKILSYTYDGTTVTDFAIRQPVRTATVEMLDSATTKAKIYKGTHDTTIQYYEGDIVKSGTEFFEALQDNINVVTSNTTNWSKLSNDNIVGYYEKNDNVEYPIGLATSNASGAGYKGNLFFTTQNKPTINASTGVITATGGVVGKTETAGDNSTKYATTAFVQTEISNTLGNVETLLSEV